MAAERDFDAIVIGGGPGGSTTAALLARKGARVLLLERE
ncbi:MAG: FAD-dependent oxidoreductase, partial [Pseudomonadales bacterium]